ncbi:MAG: hypothetical protein ACOYU2_01015 [Nitrospirota bacterium]|jgi:hypothetical protein
MELTNGFMEFFSDKEFAIPLGQVVIFVIINSFCLLFGKHKMGLLISYCFVMYWGFIFNQTYFINILGKTSWGLTVYIFAGVVMFITIIIGYFQHKD